MLLLLCDYCLNQIITVIWRFFKFKILLPLSLFLALLLLVEIRRSRSGMIYSQDINWYKAETIGISNINFLFFFSSRISTECHYCDIFQALFQLGGSCMTAFWPMRCKPEYDVGLLARLFLRGGNSWEESPFFFLLFFSTAWHAFIMTGAPAAVLD